MYEGNPVPSKSARYFTVGTFRNATETVSTISEAMLELDALTELQMKVVGSRELLHRCADMSSS